MFSGLERPSHLIVLALLFVLLFGYKKLPDASRSIGRSLRIFKAETKGLRNDDGSTEATADKPAVTGAPEQTGATSVKHEERIGGA